MPKLEDVFITHLKEFAQFVDLEAGNESQFIVSIPDGHSVWVEAVVLFSFEAKSLTWSEITEHHRPVPVGETGDVEVDKVTVLVQPKSGYRFRPKDVIFVGNKDRTVMIKRDFIDRAMCERSFASISDALIAGCGNALIQIAEVFHSREFADIADEIADRLDTRLILIAGPSSSGKTSTSLRLATQLRVIGISPIVIGMDDYFKNREDTPVDENGQLDFECIGALDVDLLSRQMNELFEGREVNIPTFDFILGKRVFNPEKTVRMRTNDIIILEGIHGLNPEPIKNMDKSRIFTIYASIIHAAGEGDIEHPEYFTRLLRRMVRDNNFRGQGPLATFERWSSVLAGEDKNIIPYIENADIKFDSALIYELPLFKSYADTMLRSVRKDSEFYEDAQKILNDIFRQIASLTPAEVATIPSNSIVREFIGGQVLRY